MTAGLELDALVAEKVMGCTPYLYTQCPRPFMRCGCKNQQHETTEEQSIGIAHYSTDIAAAWLVVEKLKIRLDPVVHGWTATVCNHQNYPFGPLPSTHCLSAPHAICLAALEAVGYDEQLIQNAERVRNSDAPGDTEQT